MPQKCLWVAIYSNKHKYCCCSKFVLKRREISNIVLQGAKRIKSDDPYWVLKQRDNGAVKDGESAYLSVSLLAGIKKVREEVLQRRRRSVKASMANNAKIQCRQL